MKKRIYELIIQFSYDRPQQLQTYLPQIKETCIRSFVGDSNSLVKESSLQLLLRIVDAYPTQTVKKIVKPVELIKRLLDEIKLRRPSATVKGAIWHLVGLLHKQFGPELRDDLEESQDQMFIELKEQFVSQKPENKTIIGIITGLSLSLESGCTLTDDEIEGLFVRVKTGMQPIEEIKQRGIQKACMKLFTIHVNMFKKVIPKHAEQMVKLTLKLCVDTDINIRDGANDMLGKLMKVISDGLTVDETIHKDIFRLIIQQFQQILEDPNNNVQLISAIKAIGVFSKAIKIFMSEDMLFKYLERLIELSEFKLIKEFEETKNPHEEDVQNFKYILKKQKQLISYIESYSYILMELRDAPTDIILTHFFKVCSIGVSNHRKLFEKYKQRFYEALASLIKSMSQHRTQFLPWIRKFVRKTLQETLKIPDAAIFGGEAFEESLKDGIQFWRELLNKEIWDEFTCRIVYDELIFTVFEDVKDLNLTYRVNVSSTNPKLQQASSIYVVSDQNEDDENGKSGLISYEANNNNHQQYLRRLADFLEIFVPSCHDMWFVKWVPQVTEILIKKSLETPRIPKLYQIMMVSMRNCSKYKYFDIICQDDEVEQQPDEIQSSQDIDLKEKINLFNRLLSYFKDLIGKSEEYQDELLYSCIDLLLQVPIALLYNKDIGTDNIKIWKGVMIKALELGHMNSDNRIAMTCINMLEEWFNTLPPNQTARLYQEILPKLSDYLSIEVIHTDEPQKMYHQRVLDKETEFGRAKITQKEISNKVLDLLGKIGGCAHNIINNELSKKHDKENFIRWDPEKRLKFSLPLYNHTFDVYLDSCLPRIVDLAQNSNKTEIRIAACEFLHSLIIFMIGKNAQKAKVRKVGGKRGGMAQQIEDQKLQEQQAAFAKLYAKLFPVMIKLATDQEQIARQLFEPLCYQIVRWFSSSKFEHPEVESLLESLIEGAQNKNNTQLRQLCSNAMAVFAKWSLKQMTDQEIAENPVNIKSLIRRIESNSNHPDPFKRLSSVLCFNKIFSVIREFESLVDRFCLEICYSVLSSLKLCYDKMELSYEVIETSRMLIPKIEKVILAKHGILIKNNKNRDIISDLQTMQIFLFEKFKCFETVYRRESVKLWENLVKKCPPIKSDRLGVPNDLKKWIRDYYCVYRKERSVLKALQQISFECQSEMVVQGKTQPVARKQFLSSCQKNHDQLSSQIEFLLWLLTKGEFSLSELHKLEFKSSIVSANINSFLRNVIQKSFLKNKTKIFEEVILMKEDKEILTKSQIQMMVQLYQLFNLLLTKCYQQDGVNTFLKQCVNGIESGLSDSQSKKSNEHQFLFEMSIYIILVPQIFKLQMLVESKELESELRSQALLFLQNFISLETTESHGKILNLLVNSLYDDCKILDLTKISSDLPHIYSPRVLLNLCLGYLKLAEVDPEIKPYLNSQMRAVTRHKCKKVSKGSEKETMKTVVETWLDSDQPYENESGRILVKFFTKVGLGNQVLLEWVTSRNVVYLKCSEMILSYIAQHWGEEQVEEEPLSGEGSDVEMNNEVEPGSPQQIIQMTQNSMVSNSQKAVVADEEDNAKYSCLAEFLIAKIDKHESALYSLFIPIIESLSDLNGAHDYRPMLIKFIPVYCQKEVKHEFKDVAINQIKIFGLIALKSQSLLQDPTNKEAQAFIQYVIKCVNSFLKERFSVYVKREAFNLISLISHLPVSSGYISQKTTETVYDLLLPSLNYAKKQHFPPRSRDLKESSNEGKNFKTMIEAFLNMAIITKNLKVLRSLYNIIREPTTTFERTLKNSINIIVTQQINILQPISKFMKCLTEFMNEFLNRNMDLEIDDNIRWSIATKIIMRILETCSQEQLTEFMVQYSLKFEDVLKCQREDLMQGTPLEYYLLIKEKTLIMQFIEVVYRRLPVETIKEVLHVRLYGKESKQNELTKSLIEIGTECKNSLIKDFKEHCTDQTIETNFKQDNGPLAVQMQFSQAAYTMLSSIIVCTQKNEKAFANFLFNSRQGASDDDKKPSMWELLIDVEKKFEFPVQTNFNHIQLKSIEQKLIDFQAKHEDFAGAKIETMMSDYLTNSFMNTNEKFNQDMVFETKIESINIKSEEQAYKQIFQNKQGKSQDSQEKSKAAELTKEEDIEFELDIVNQHKCMKNIRRTMQKMRDLFTQSWVETKDKQPLFAQYLLDEYLNSETHLNVKIFILKMISNNQKMFQPYAKYWFEPICQYVIQKDNGGKGFHYFLRDLCTLLISWNYIPENPDESLIKLMTKVINTLIRISTDEVKVIFKQNIKIISSLMQMWKKFIAVDKWVVTKMLMLSDSEPKSQLWKMNAIEVLALAICNNIPILPNTEDLSLRENWKLFQSSNSQKLDPLLKSLVKIFESKKKQVIYATSELIGMILNQQKEESNFKEEILKPIKMAIFANEVRERHDVFVYSIERVTREYNQLFLDKEMFLKTLSFINNLTGSMRAAVFQSCERFVAVARSSKGSIADVNEIAMSLLGVSKDILADMNDENQQAFLGLLICLSQLQNVDSIEKLLALVVPQLKKLFVRNKNQYSRGRFFDLMVKLYDLYDSYKSNDMVRSSLIHGLSDPSLMIRDKLAAFWNDKNRLDIDPTKRLQQLMDIMYHTDEEQIWLKNSAYLILNVSSMSPSNFNRKIFEEPLQECHFTPYNFQFQNFNGMNRSQPMTPILTQIQQMIQSSQDGINDQVRQRQTEQQLPENSQEAAPFRQQYPQHQYIEQGFVRATQLPQFTQTQGPASMLIAGFKGGQQATLSDSFYGINNKGLEGKQSKNEEEFEPNLQQPNKNTQLFVINEDDEADDQAQPSPPQRDDDGFIAPMPKQRKGNANFKSFFRANNFHDRPMELTQGQKIRFTHEATMPSSLARQEHVRTLQRQQYVQKSIYQTKKQQVPLYRKYRYGELPDIEIAFKDVLLPLMAIVRADSTIATEVFVEVFQEIYKSQNDKDVRSQLGEGLKTILESSQIYDYSTINCVHRIALELLKIDGFTMNSEVIGRTGEHSMSFQTSLILLEESIIRGKAVSMSQDSSTKRKLDTVNSQISQENKQYWFRLIKLYEIIGEQDALHGIWCELAQRDGMMFKKEIEAEESAVQILSQAENINTSNAASTQKNETDQVQVVNLIKQAQELKNKGQIEQALRLMEKTLRNPQLCRDFDESIKKELDNKKFEYMSELLKWDDIAHELLEESSNQQIHEIASNSGFKKAALLVRSQIRSVNCWPQLTQQLNTWIKDDYSKTMLERNLSYEIAMFYITPFDYDRSRINIERESQELLSQWKNLTKLSQVAQHFLVQRIQKIYEMKEFLGLIQDFNDGQRSPDEQMQKVIKSMINWKHRSPSYSFDPLSVWDDILTSRQMFIDHYCIKYENSYLTQAIQGQKQALSSQPLSQRLKEDLSLISDIQVMLNIQTAKGAFKIGAYDSSDRYLKQFQSKNNNKIINDMRIIVPIIKLKQEQTKSEIKNFSFQQKLAKVDKIARVLNDKMTQNQFDLTNIDQEQIQNTDLEIFDHLSLNPSFESIKTVIKSNVLKFTLQKKQLSIILGEAKNETTQGLKKYVQSTNYHIAGCFDSLEQINLYLQRNCLINQEQAEAQGSIGQTQQVQTYKIHQQGKLLLKFSKFADKLLRKITNGEKNGSSALVDKGLTSINKSEITLAKLLIQNGLQSLNLGYSKASEIVPRIIDVVGQYQDKVKQEFIEWSKHTPSWLFLRWISQITAVLNRPESEIISELVKKIATKYPQAVFYPFKVIQSNIEINFSNEDILRGQKEAQSLLFQKLRESFDQFNTLNKWIEALDCLIFPEHRFIYWYKLITDICEDPQLKQLIVDQSPKNPLLLKVHQLTVFMYNDIMARQKRFVQTQIGKYNKQFIDKWEGEFTKSFGKDGSKISSMTLKPLVTELQRINKKMNEVRLFQGMDMISKYSEWMDQYDCNEFYQVKNYIEIPGQDESGMFHQEPITSKNVKIANFKKVCLVLGSIRRPKKITIHGNNEKDYHILVKGGEDLRLDQRVQQLFTIMNSIFSSDPSCENRDLNIKTFKVVPVSNRLGIFEWVDNTEPLKALISKEHKNLENGQDIHESRAFRQREAWLQKVAKNDGLKSPNLAHMHLSVLKLDEKSVVKAFQQHQAAMPNYLLRNALENLCLNSSAFLTIKNQFIKSMAVFSVASYLIGIGDRHLENFLIDTTDGELQGIDFGIAFGSNVHLAIPELMPFRLTQQIEGVIAPHPLEGVYKQTMVHALRALRKKKSLILDACEIFVKEPLLDWIKDARQMNKHLSGAQDDIQVDLTQFQRQKIESVREKLLGANPVTILRQELYLSVHEKRPYINELKKVIRGQEGSQRKNLARQNLKYLDVEDQIDILIELARDPNILGRTWIGWSPYI